MSMENLASRSGLKQRDWVDLYTRRLYEIDSMPMKVHLRPVTMGYRLPYNHDLSSTHGSPGPDHPVVDPMVPASPGDSGWLVISLGPLVVKGDAESRHGVPHLHGLELGHLGRHGAGFGEQVADDPGKLGGKEHVRREDEGFQPVPDPAGTHTIPAKSKIQTFGGWD